MKHVSLFDDYTLLEGESYNFDSDSLFESKINQMLSIRQGKAAWSKEELSDFFSGSINENISEEGREYFLEKIYQNYELGLLYEYKKNWFDDPERVHYLVTEDSAILFKGNEMHIISLNSLESLKNGDFSLDEGWEWISNAWDSGVKWAKNNIVEPAKKAVKKYIIEPVKQAAEWVGDKFNDLVEFLTDGAKKLWALVKQIYAAVKAFVQENPLTAIGILLQLLASVIGMIPVVGQGIAAILSTIGGGITVYEGVTDIIKAYNIIGRADKVIQIVKGGAKLVFGGVGTILGIRDIIMSSAEAATFTGGFALAIKGQVIAWSRKFSGTAFGAAATVGAGKVLGCSTWLGEFFQTLCSKAPFMKNLASKSGRASKIVKYGAQGADAAKGNVQSALIDSENPDWDGKINESNTDGWSFGELLVNFMSYVGQSCFSFIYNAVISGIAGVGKAINGLVNLPGRISDSIDRFRSNASGLVETTLAKALSFVVGPMAKCVKNFINEYIKPSTDKLTGWMISLGKRNKDITAKIKSNPKLKSPVPDIKKSSAKKIPAQPVKLSSSDTKNIKILGDAGNKQVFKSQGFLSKYKDIFSKVINLKKDFAKKYPATANLKGTIGTDKKGDSILTYQSDFIEGYISLYISGKYLIISGPNKGAKGDFRSTKNKIILTPPKGGFKKSKKNGKKKNESRNYISTFESFSFS